MHLGILWKIYLIVINRHQGKTLFKKQNIWQHPQMSGRGILVLDFDTRRWESPVSDRGAYCLYGEE